MSQDVRHTYHLVDPSPWPILAAIGVFLLAFGAVGYMRGAFGLPEGSLYLLLPGGLVITYVLFGWWRDLVTDSEVGHSTEVVRISLRYGMVLFILSEVMFFVGWFWSFFEMAIYHAVRAGSTYDVEQFESLAQWAQWPPMQTDGHRVETFDPFSLPLVNTLILLLSSCTVTWAHHALQTNDRKNAAIGLAMTVALGAVFTVLQVIEYSHAHFTYGGSLYGSAFFMATGFHGAHVVIGTIFLTVCLGRLLAGGMSPEKHLGFECAAWYWHFVDVVWLFLFSFVYVTPWLALGG